tara:strand:+ start:467 stop:790 length:324 start_codon:yes stop_codon:yes gene_type:complete
MATKILAEQNIKDLVEWKWGATCYVKYKDGNWEIFEWASDDIEQPTNAEIEAEIPNYQAVLDSKHYQNERAVEYPSIQDQLDDLYHNGIDGWKDTIKAVKDKYPKEE